MWVMEVRGHALAYTRHTGHIYLVSEHNLGFMVVHFGCVYRLETRRLWELVACKDFLRYFGTTNGLNQHMTVETSHNHN